LSPSGTASDNVKVERVELSTDGTTWILATGTASWSATLTLTEGPNTVYARAVDSSANLGYTSVSVMVVVSLPPPAPWILVGVTAGVAAAAVGVGFLILRCKRAS
jgi:ABC-type nitrate/sulfonate/bicarbonate transport system permease component